MNVLELRGLRVSLDTDRGPIVAVEDTSLALRSGETLALVGESGAGKTMTGLAIMGLAPRNARIETGEVLLEGRNLFELSPAELRALRGRELAMIFQDPMTALNPLLTVGEQLAEVLRAHARLPRREVRARCVSALAEVGLPDPERNLRSYPHQLSGGMRQRVMIAMALLLEPAVLIADEPTTALDVTVQAQVIQLLRDLQARRGTAILLVTHDLGVVAAMADRVAVMYAGALVEVGEAEAVFRRPHHPYTFALLQSIPSGATPLGTPLPTIPGEPPDPTHTIMGCSFAPRCPFRLDRCELERPLLGETRVADAETLRSARLLFVGGRRAACFEKERVGQLTALWAQSLDWGALAAGLDAPEPSAPRPGAGEPVPAPDGGLRPTPDASTDEARTPAPDPARPPDPGARAEGDDDRGGRP